MTQGDSLENIAYSLVKHGNFTFQDTLVMSYCERMKYYELLKAEIEEQKKELSTIKSRRGR
jgi:hypothetical protein